MRDSMPVLKAALSIDAPPDEVWRILTTPELVREWACAYVEGASIRTSWREGDPVTWMSPRGARVRGSVAAFKPGRLLKFVYADEEAKAPREPRSFAETFELTREPHGTRLELTTGPLDKESYEALKAPTEKAIREIKSLAEESAQIHGLRRAS
jgi:uncharacterized protein YndB with AHSA1/START domain